MPEQPCPTDVCGTCSVWQTCYMSPIPFCPPQVFQLFLLPSLTCSASQSAPQLFPIFYSFVRCKILSFFPLALRHPATLQALSWSSCLMIWTFIFRVVFFFIIAFTILLFYSWSFKWLSTEVSLLSCYKTLKYTQFSFFWNVVGAPGSSDIFFLPFSVLMASFYFFQKSTKKPSHFV